MGKTYKDRAKFTKNKKEKTSYDEEFIEAKTKYKKRKQSISLEIIEDFDEEDLVIVSNEKK